MTDIYTIETVNYTAVVDENGNVIYTDKLTREQVIEYIKSHLDDVPEQVRPIVAWALSEPCRKVLLRKGGIGEGWFHTFPVRHNSTRIEFEKYGTVNDLGQFWFRYADKQKALAWLKTGCRKGLPNFHKQNAKYYGVNLGPLGWVSIEKPRQNYGTKPWLVCFTLPKCKPAEPLFLPGYTIPKEAFGA